jgi:hypothetical protein
MEGAKAMHGFFLSAVQQSIYFKIVDAALAMQRVIRA